MTHAVGCQLNRRDKIPPIGSYQTAYAAATTFYMAAWGFLMQASMLHLSASGVAAGQELRQKQIQWPCFSTLLTVKGVSVQHQVLDKPSAATKDACAVFHIANAGD